jgi:ribosomal-protein-alanine N-acetyltransferase
VQAGVMPRNAGSLRVLEKVGFRREGLALRYLQINDVWEDHVILAVTAEEWPVVR